jgi:hypothetical protein
MASTFPPYSDWTSTVFVWNLAADRNETRIRPRIFWLRVFQNEERVVRYITVVIVDQNLGLNVGDVIQLDSGERPARVRES